ncbi:MAG: hypothetical protein Q8N03_00660 [Ignavibacteria bacterium]|nr:hypothetical protein [Ignavibacteria bacterium]
MKNRTTTDNNQLRQMKFRDSICIFARRLRSASIEVLNCNSSLSPIAKNIKPHCTKPIDVLITSTIHYI